MRYDEAKIDEAVLAETRHDRAAPESSKGIFWPKILRPMVGAATESVIWLGMKLLCTACLTTVRAISCAGLGGAKVRFDDGDEAASFFVGAAPRRSTKH